jgi:hypothetical protein
MSGTTGTVLDPRIVALLQQYGQQPANTTNPNAAGYTPPHQGPVAPGTPYAGPQPLFAGGYNTLAPSDFANYKASLQAPDPNWQAPQQPLPGLMDNDAAQIAQAKKLFDNPNGYWSGGEGSGGNGGGQR